jgi:peptidoglycan/LPS O-acetylase OafA/YrhL
MKTLQMVKAIIPVVAFALALYAGFNASHVHNQEQSGWMMMCMFALALTVISLESIGSGTSWFPHILAALAIVCGLAFALHYFGGDQGVREFIRWFHWIYQQISKGYADTLH